MTNANNKLFKIPDTLARIYIKLHFRINQKKSYTTKIKLSTRNIRKVHASHSSVFRDGGTRSISLRFWNTKSTRSITFSASIINNSQTARKMFVLYLTTITIARAHLGMLPTPADLQWWYENMHHRVYAATSQRHTWVHKLLWSRVWVSGLSCTLQWKWKRVHQFCMKLGNVCTG